jgi:hypothetical protein
LAHPLGKRGRARLAGHVAGEIAEGVALRCEHGERPARFDRHLGDESRGHPDRHGEAVANVLVALAVVLAVHGDHQRAAAGCLRAVDQPVGEVAVLAYIELEPEGGARRRRDILDRADADGR